MALESIGKRIVLGAFSAATLSSCATSCAQCPSFATCSAHNQASSGVVRDSATGAVSYDYGEVADVYSSTHSTIITDSNRFILAPDRGVRCDSLFSYALAKYGSGAQPVYY